MHDETDRRAVKVPTAQGSKAVGMYIMYFKGPLINWGKTYSNELDDLSQIVSSLLELDHEVKHYYSLLEGV